jgi:pimeloyl-ACP methyl ester carboxylesterase
MPVVRAGDLDVSYRETGRGTPLVLVHGNWATNSWWEPTLARLPAGRRGIAPDMRGRGGTRGPDNEYSIPSLAEDLRAFADAIGLERFDLVGHSLGSCVAMQFALAHGERLRSLTVVSPGWIDGMPGAYAIPERQRQLRDDPAFFGLALRAIIPGAPDDEFWQRLLRDGREQTLAAALALLPALTEWAPGDAVGRISVPRTVISGELDLFTGGPNATRVANALGCELVTMPKVGHGPMIEAPDAFAATLFSRLPAP